MDKTKLVGTFERRVMNEQGDVEITFSLHDWNYKKYATELEHGKKYTLDMTDYKDKRSNEQNRLMWELIGQIDYYLNGPNGDTWELYLQLLESTNIKSVDISIEPEAAEELKKIYRASRYIGPDMMDTTRCIYRCYTGSSKFNKTEFSRLIDRVLEYANECGIDTAYYYDQFK